MGGQTSCCTANTTVGIPCFKHFGDVVLKTEMEQVSSQDDPCAGSADHVPACQEQDRQGEVGKGSQQVSTETYEDGSTYTGNFVDGKRHGHGVWMSQTEQYEGQWMDDHRHGQGRQTWQDGRMYTGQFRAGKFNGDGHMVWRTNAGLMSYEGQYVDDVKHGQGKYTWPDRRMYEGGWHNGKRTGTAICTSSAGERRHGIWKDDAVVQWLEDVQPTL